MLNFNIEFGFLYSIIVKIFSIPYNYFR
jgi:hypothetical protein